MGNILFGIIAMGLFIAFIIWKNRKNTRSGMSDLDKMHDQEYWDKKENFVQPVDQDDGNDDFGDD